MCCGNAGEARGGESIRITESRQVPSIPTYGLSLSVCAGSGPAFCSWPVTGRFRLNPITVKAHLAWLSTNQQTAWTLPLRAPRLAVIFIGWRSPALHEAVEEARGLLYLFIYLLTNLLTYKYYVFLLSLPFLCMPRNTRDKWYGLVCVHISFNII